MRRIFPFQFYVLLGVVVLVLLLVSLVGCMMTDIKTPKEHITGFSFWKDTNWTEVYLDESDPNNVTLWLTGYDSKSKGIAFKFNPITKAFELVIDNADP